MQRGVLCGILAGAFWGVIFLVPRQLPDFSPLQLSAGRYMMYGLVSLVALLPMVRRVVPRFTRADLAALVKLALAGNLVYYLFVAAAVQYAGIAPASLIVGVLPVTTTFFARHDLGAASFARLVWPLLMIAAGIACINIDVFSFSSAAVHTHVSVPMKLAGVCCAVAALTCWTWFSVENARYLQRKPHFSSNEWSVLWGVVTGTLGALLWLGFALLPAGSLHPAASPTRWHTFWLLNLGLAIGASWLGNSLWNAAARRLPLTLSGQMIVFETLFALLYGFIYEHRLPRVPEVAAIVLLIVGVIWSVRQHADEPRTSQAELPIAHGE